MTKKPGERADQTVTRTLPEWWVPVLESIAGIRLDSTADLRRVAAAVRELSHYLNDTAERRESTTRYMNSTRAREAYLLYFSTVNLLKLLPALRELNATDVLQTARLRVLDVGCGPGTGVAGLHAFFQDRSERPILDITAADAVQSNVRSYARAAELIAAQTGIVTEVRETPFNLATPRGIDEEYDLIIGMNVLNELPRGKRKGAMQWLGEHLSANGHLLVIEPALRETSRELLELRDYAVETGWTVFAPCFRQADCPALQKATDWCHHDVPWQRPGFIEAIDEEIGNVKHSLKFSYLLLNRHDSTLGDHLDTDDPHRVVSELFVEKGRTWCYSCSAAGREVLQRNKRDRGEANMDFDALERYDIIEMNGIERREHDNRVPPGGTVRRITAD